MRVLPLALFTLLSACVTQVSYLPLHSPPHVLTERPESEVELFTESRPERPHVEVAVIEANDEVDGRQTREEVLATLRRTAAERGCDGLVVLGSRGYRGTCIVYSEPSAERGVGGSGSPSASDDVEQNEAQGL